MGVYFADTGNALSTVGSDIADWGQSAPDLRGSHAKEVGRFTPHLFERVSPENKPGSTPNLDDVLPDRSRLSFESGCVGYGTKFKYVLLSTFRVRVLRQHLI